MPKGVKLPLRGVFLSGGSGGPAYDLAGTGAFSASQLWIIALIRPTTANPPAARQLFSNEGAGAGHQFRILGNGVLSLEMTRATTNASYRSATNFITGGPQWVAVAYDENGVWGGSATAKLFAAPYDNGPLVEPASYGTATAGSGATVAQSSSIRVAIGELSAAANGANRWNGDVLFVAAGLGALPSQLEIREFPIRMRRLQGTRIWGYPGRYGPDVFIDESGFNAHGTAMGSGHKPSALGILSDTRRSRLGPHILSGVVPFGADLASALQVSLTVTPAVTVDKPLGTTLTLSVSEAAELTLEKPLDAVLPVSISLAADATVPKPLAADLLLAFAQAAALSVDKLLDASLPITFAMSADVEVPKPLTTSLLIALSQASDLSGGGVLLDATLPISIAANPDLTIEKLLATALGIAVSAAGDLTVPKPLVAALDVVLGSAAALEVPKPLAIALDIALATGSDLTIPKPLLAELGITVTTSGNLLLEKPLAAALAIAIALLADLASLDLTGWVVPVAGGPRFAVPWVGGSRFGVPVTGKGPRWSVPVEVMQ